MFYLGGCKTFLLQLLPSIRNLTSGELKAIISLHCCLSKKNFVLKISHDLMQEILFLEFMVDPARWNYLICIRFIWIIKKMVMWNFFLHQMTALHKAAEGGHMDIVRYLIEKEADIGIQDRIGVSICDSGAYKRLHLPSSHKRSLSYTSWIYNLVSLLH